MVEYLTRFSMRRLRAGGMLVAGSLLSCSVVFAQALTDPTRPPSGADSEQPTAAAPAGQGMVLQSIIRSPRKIVAIIDGQTVRVGDLIGEDRVASIGDNEVVLRHGSERRVLALYPSIKSPSITARHVKKHLQTDSNKDK